MAQFEWFEFTPLSKDDFISHFQDSKINIEYCYIRWCELYKRCGMRFYRYQYNRHCLVEFREFCYENHINIKFIEELDQDEKYYQSWQKWKQNSSDLEKHFNGQQILIKQLSYPTDKEGQLLQDVGILLIEDIIQGWNGKIQTAAKGLWFNLNINSTPEEQAYFKKIPYSNYLRSSHWRRVRSAMILLEGAICNECLYHHGGESYYGTDWDSELQVHHLHYKNLGCERYEDLQLLCKPHHKQVHLNLTK
ncbi:hypothetical protein Cylst_0234 [Cylindrospermum stagnale PCC 7417]|uniref:HNH nuclease domain-containing protein n=1 Tax=Cylindrospermum stagnale PCC 7417 TaxID=56107 RepID=K9WR18_9NOST|nr:HNH endonuclease [Cylindrospermum stagnale]AFZ22608.1 hypothetical protein Cylst_0234 [Cylindrospermum stagnale PCC 7417]